MFKTTHMQFHLQPKKEQGLVPSISPLVLSGDRDAQSFVFCVVLFRPLFVIVIFLFLLTMVL
jgi:hypothetical protein